MTLEVLEAVKFGYQIKETFEVWHWNKSKVYDLITKTGGLFTEYVNTFLKAKQEASGYPDNVKSEMEKDKYIFDNYDKEGIKLDKSQIEKNPGLRNVMKIMLNNNWCRFGMKSNRVQHKVISTVDDWYNLINVDQYEVQSIDLSHESVIHVFDSVKENQHQGCNETNVPIAAFVTCHARLKLFQELNRLGSKVLYFEFLSAGPKNYSYKLASGKKNCTVKGFTLNKIASEKLNFDAMKNMVCNNRSSKIDVAQQSFTRNKFDWKIQSSTINKKYGFVYSKRRIVNDFETLPFGF